MNPQKRIVYLMLFIVLFFSHCGDTGLDVETWTMISKIEEIIK